MKQGGRPGESLEGLGRSSVVDTMKIHCNVYHCNDTIENTLYSHTRSQKINKINFKKEKREKEIDGGWSMEMKNQI